MTADRVSEEIMNSIIGNLEKPFHAPECLCVECASWFREQLAAKDRRIEELKRLIEELKANESW
jgi:hypothetical protein